MSAGKGVSVGTTWYFADVEPKIVLYMVISTHIWPFPADPCEARSQLHRTPDGGKVREFNRVTAGKGVSVGNAVAFCRH